MKPLGGKAYGSIPHLLGSKLGEGDHHIHEGQHKICTEKTRDKHDVVIVQEKLDGSCVSIAKINGEIIALTRAGYLANSSPYEQHWYFDKYVKHYEAIFKNLLKEGERLCGEWLVMAHGTKYNLKASEHFIAFDFLTGKERLNYNDFKVRCSYFGIPTPHEIHKGAPFPIEKLPNQSFHGADYPEGAIYRVERKGVVDFIGKYVHSYYVPGRYFDSQNKGLTTWNVNIQEYK